MERPFIVPNLSTSYLYYAFLLVSLRNDFQYQHFFLLINNTVPEVRLL